MEELQLPRGRARASSRHTRPLTARSTPRSFAVSTPRRVRVIGGVDDSRLRHDARSIASAGLTRRERAAMTMQRVLRGGAARRHLREKVSRIVVHRTSAPAFLHLIVSRIRDTAMVSHSGSASVMLLLARGPKHSRSALELPLLQGHGPRFAQWCAMFTKSAQLLHYARHVRDDEFRTSYEQATQALVASAASFDRMLTMYEQQQQASDRSGNVSTAVLTVLEQVSRDCSLLKRTMARATSNVARRLDSIVSTAQGALVDTRIAAQALVSKYDELPPR